MGDALGWLVSGKAWMDSPGPFICWLVIIVCGLATASNLPDDARLPERIAAAILWPVIVPLMGLLGLTPLVRRLVRESQRQITGGRDDRR